MDQRPKINDFFCAFSQILVMKTLLFVYLLCKSEKGGKDARLLETHDKRGADSEIIPKMGQQTVE
jgi:hypothetical protein